MGRGRSCQVLQSRLWQFATPSPIAAAFVELKLVAVRKFLSLLLLMLRAWKKEKISESSTRIQPSHSVRRAEAHLTLSHWKTRGKLRHHL